MWLCGYAATPKDTKRSLKDTDGHYFDTEGHYSDKKRHYFDTTDTILLLRTHNPSLVSPKLTQTTLFYAHCVPQEGGRVGGWQSKCLGGSPYFRLFNVG